MTIKTLGDFLYWAEKTFTEADLYYGHGTDNPWDEALALARFVLKLPPDVDKSAAEQILQAEDIHTLKQLVEKRIGDHIPVPYLTHEAWFAGLKFYVDERVIIPRSPLAELIETEFQAWLERPVHRILDLCTGSGCIAIAASYAFPEAHIDAVDISPDALAVAHKNLKLHNCEDRVKVFQSDLFDACGQERYDLIISNPPYVDRLDLENLPLEFQWEPAMALAAGDDGLQIVRRILRQASQYLTPKGVLIVEVGNSEIALQEAYPEIPFTWLTFERGGHGVFLLRADEMGVQV